MKSPQNQLACSLACASLIAATCPTTTEAAIMVEQGLVQVRAEAGDFGTRQFPLSRSETGDLSEVGSFNSDFSGSYATTPRSQPAASSFDGADGGASLRAVLTTESTDTSLGFRLSATGSGTGQVFRQPGSTRQPRAFGDSTAGVLFTVDAPSVFRASGFLSEDPSEGEGNDSLAALRVLAPGDGGIEVIDIFHFNASDGGGRLDFNQSGVLLPGLDYSFVVSAASSGVSAANSFVPGGTSRFDGIIFDVTQPVPEPTTFALTAAGSLLVLRRRRRQA